MGRGKPIYTVGPSEDILKPFDIISQHKFKRTPQIYWGGILIFICVVLSINWAVVFERNQILESL